MVPFTYWFYSNIPKWGYVAAERKEIKTNDIVIEFEKTTLKEEEIDRNRSKFQHITIQDYDVEEYIVVRSF